MLNHIGNSLKFVFQDVDDLVAVIRFVIGWEGEENVEYLTIIVRMRIHTCDKQLWMEYSDRENMKLKCFNLLSMLVAV